MDGLFVRIVGFKGRLPMVSYGRESYRFPPRPFPGDYDGLTARDLKQLEKIIHEKHDEIAKAWKKHFGA